MQNQYTTSFRIPQPECDINRNFTLGGILRAVQQVGMEQCELQNVGTEYLLRFQTAWLLAKTSVEFYTPLKENTLLKAVTDPCIPHHAVYKRVTSFFVPDGSLAAQVDARWVLADINTRKILRHLPEGMQLPYMSEVAAEHRVDIVRAEPLCQSGTVTADYSRVDMNRHLNNTRYGDILCDAVPLSIWEQGGWAKKAVICYRNELPMGHEMALLRAECDYHGQPAYYLVGQAGDTRYFEANLIF